VLRVVSQDDADNQSDLSYVEEHHWYPTRSEAASPVTEDPIRLRPVGPLEVQRLVREGGEANEEEAQESLGTRAQIPTEHIVITVNI